jgi:hypothetical protein
MQNQPYNLRFSSSSYISTDALKRSWLGCRVHSLFHETFSNVVQVPNHLFKESERRHTLTQMLTQLVNCMHQSNLSRADVHIKHGYLFNITFSNAINCIFHYALIN